MHDSFLLHKLAASLQRICDENRLGGIKEIVIDVSSGSHITGENLKEHLLELLPNLVSSDTDITVRKTAMDEQEAVIYMLKGDRLEV